MKLAGIIIGVLVISLAGLYFFIRHRINNIPDRGNLEAELDLRVHKFIDEGKSYAFVLGVIKDGKELIKGYGTVKQGGQLPPDSSTIFELASTSKLFTTAVLQIMADNGELALDEKIRSYLTGIVKLPAAAAETTLRHLATHSSGFPSLPEAFLSKMTDATSPYKDLVRQDMYDYLKTCTGKKPEGEFEYSNFGMGLLGHLLELEAASGFEQLVKERLLYQLDMQHTFIHMDQRNNAGIVQGYDESGTPAPVWTDQVLTGAGSFLSNGADMLKFLKASLGENNTPVSRSLIATQQPQAGGQSGLGWIMATRTDKFLGNDHIVWHNGMAGGYASLIVVDRVNKYGLFILSNKAVDVTMLGMKLATVIRTQSWQEAIPARIK